MAAASKPHRLWISLFLFLLCLFTRLLFLDRLPSGITNDELHFVLNSKAIFLNFSDMSGRWSPLSLATIPAETSSELPFLLTSPLIGPLPLNLFTARLPSAIFNSLLPVFIYLFSANFLSPRIGLLGGLVAIFNPWNFYAGRTAFDAPISLVFYFWAFYWLVSFRGRKILLAAIPAALAFFTYIANKIIFLPLFYSLVFYLYFIYRRRQDGRYYLGFLLIISLFFLKFLFNLFSSPEARTSELATPFSPVITAQVNQARSLSLSPPFSFIFSNRYFVFAKHLITKYLNNFSPSVFFLTGDQTPLVSLGQHGYFYLLDIAMLLAGLYFLYRHFRQLFWLLLLPVLISPIPEAVRLDATPAYAFHSSLQYPFLYLIIAIGLSKLFSKIIIFIYLIFFINFFDTYFLRYPVYRPEAFYFSHRLLARFLWFENQKSRPVYIITSEPGTLFRNYLFYNNLYNRQNFATVRQIYSQPALDRIDFGSLHFLNQAGLVDPSPDATFVLQSSLGEVKFQPYHRLSITRLNDAGEVFGLYNSLTCRQANLSRFVSRLSLQSLKIESTDENSFCQQFISYQQ